MSLTVGPRAENVAVVPGCPILPPVHYFLKTESIKGDHTVDLVGIGVVADGGRELYAISADFRPDRANSFVDEKALTQLEPPGDPAWKSPAEILFE